MGSSARYIKTRLIKRGGCANPIDSALLRVQFTPRMFVIVRQFPSAVLLKQQELSHPLTSPVLFFCFHIEEALWSSEQNRDFHVGVLRIMWNVQKRGWEKISGARVCACVRACSCVRVFWSERQAGAAAQQWLAGNTLVWTFFATGRATRAV